MSEQLNEIPDIVGLPLLPTGKPHVSFSEIAEWTKCSWKHKLRHIDKIDLSTPSHVLNFGTAVHAGCENYLKTKAMDKEVTFNMIREDWANNGFPDLKGHLEKASKILDEVPGFLDEHFQGWEPIQAEELLYESVNGLDARFKGFIDAVIKVKDKKGEDQIWLIDWKTTTWGWKLEKKQDFMTNAQLILYKTFWSQKHNIPMKSIRAGFVLLKKDGKDGSRCELLTVSVGPKSSDKAMKTLTNMVKGVQKGMAIKNKFSCDYCEFKGTKYCP